MRMNASVCAGVVAAVLSVVAAAPAQQPKVTNAQVSVRSGADLQREIAAVKTPTWIGYSVPLQHALRTNYDDSVAYLEGNPRRDEIVSEPKPGVAMRKSAVFALSRLPAEQAVPDLIQVASTSKDAATRREAIFWPGQSKDPKALEYLEKVVKE